MSLDCLKKFLDSLTINLGNLKKALCYLNNFLYYLKPYKVLLSNSMTLLTATSLRDEFIILHSSCTAALWAAFTLVTECIMINS